MLSYMKLKYLGETNERIAQAGLETIFEMSARILLAFVCVATSFPQMRTALADDIDPVINRLKVTQKEKGEFETTQQYEARQKSGFDPNKQLVFKVIDSQGFHYGARFEYDADGRAMKLSMESGMEPGLFGIHERPLMLDSKHVIRSRIKHVGKTAFGVTMPYTASIENWYGVVVREPFPAWLESFSQTVRGEAHRFEFSIPMSVSEAKATKPFLAVQVLGTIENPEIYHEEVNTTATLDSPFENSIGQDYVEFKWQELHIVDSRTGKAIQSFKEPRAVAAK